MLPRYGMIPINKCTQVTCILWPIWAWLFLCWLRLAWPIGGFSSNKLIQSMPPVPAISIGHIRVVYSAFPAEQSNTRYNGSSRASSARHRILMGWLGSGLPNTLCNRNRNKPHFID